VGADVDSDASLTDNGLIHATAAWAALDRPGASAALLDSSKWAQVRGRIAGIVSGESLRVSLAAVIGWPIGRDGRKHHVGTALVTRRVEVGRRRRPRGSMSSGS
jgi:hypothetical protein